METNTQANGLMVCNDAAQWDHFCHLSPQGTPFMMSWFTDISVHEVVRYFWMKNGVAKAAILLPMENGVPLKTYFGTYQNSLCWSSEFDSLSKGSREHQQLDILSSIIPALAEKHRHFYLYFHPQIIDMRPLLWHNYHEPQKGIFKINIRYTAVRTLTDVNTIDDILCTVRDGRRWDYKKYVNAKLSLTSDLDQSEFIDLYRKTFSRQGIQVAAETEAILRKLIEVIQSSSTQTKGFVLAARSQDNKPVSAVIIPASRTCAFYSIAASDPAFRETGANTALLFEAMLCAKRLGKTEFDFGGVNSPSRGDFKLSFNPLLCQYFEAELI